MIFAQRQPRHKPTVNASSTADIAFLLLVFFLVTTTIDFEKGIQVKLPPMDSQPPIPRNERNILSVKLNFKNELWVEGTPLAISNLREATKLHITNPGGNSDRALRPDLAIISLTNDRNTNYNTYLHVYNELKAAYNELWQEEALAQYERPFKKLTRRQQQAVKKKIPLVISEGEVVDLARN